MNIIYVSNLISENKMKNILENANEKPLQSIQKFHRLLCQGFAKNDVNIKTIRKRSYISIYSFYKF